ncbi:hypothetical protein BU16DRAFT_533816 [Lophium mytilinum]|uniref:ABM domain-containing protein n=1 Tax=Lophium mytilinum TaxID=390894 RepID=A0A6A6R8Z1_9PEZI|nr:hypothetical protein BU16DRAFT_533816 [Lophium mytilinum]
MDTTCPPFYVVARVIGSPNSFKRWTDVLTPLCAVSATEPQGNSYYWGRDDSGAAPDTLWGLEGYTHAIGFFTGHPSSDVFKREMGIVEREGLLGEDYDLKHYDFAGGWLTREDDAEKDAQDSYVAVHHFWAKERGRREALIGWLLALAGKAREEVAGGVQSAAVLRECNDLRLATLWVRTRSKAEFEKYQASEVYKEIIGGELKEGGSVVGKVELHTSQNFIGHIDKTPAVKQVGSHEINFGRVRG